MKNRKIIFTVLSALVCFGLCQQTQSATDTPDPGSVPLSNTADGQNALLSITTGIYNSAFGFDSLLSLADGPFNTGLGAGTLLLNTGSTNTAVGAGALLNNADGSFNNAVGAFALFNNVSGFFNNAHGRNALLNSTGDQNNGMGDDVMEANTTGSFNTAIGDDALDSNVDGNSNVAIGDEAGTAVVHGSHIIAIGADVTGGGSPFTDFDDTCFIGSIHDEPISDPGSAQAVLVDQFNVVGIAPSSQRFKHDIQPMNNASEALLSLKPVTFKYNFDKKGMTQYGLVAEEVAKVNPDLVTRNKDGEIASVRYEQVNAMLLNEFLKEHKKVQSLETTVAQQQKGMEILTAQLKEQAAQIQKVSAQLEVNKPASKVVANKP
ncbi:MAG: hypothetical protein DME65_12310 [Verrucomicrobia bacterium]|nr:MAG: hypothetical protein DME65_12310 [Verrucomicrobiota bacterium]